MSLISPYYLEDAPEGRIRGYSVLGERTGFYVPELGIHLDAGLATRSPAKHICISHASPETIRAFDIIAKGRSGLTTVYCPYNVAPTLRRYDNTRVVAMLSGSHMPLGDAAGTVVRAFGTRDALAYQFVRRRSIIRKEYANRTDTELLGLIGNGVSVYRRKTDYLLSYIFDGVVEQIPRAFLRSDLVLTAGGVVN